MESWMIFIKLLATSEQLAIAINRPRWIAIERVVQMMNADRTDLYLSDVYGFYRR